MDFLFKLSSVPLREEQIYSSGESDSIGTDILYIPDWNSDSDESIDKNKKTRRRSTLRKIMRPLNLFTKMAKEDNATEDKMEITTDDFDLIVRKLRELNVLTHEGVKEVAAQELLRRRGYGKMERLNGSRDLTFTADNFSSLEKMNGSRDLSFPDNFLTEASKKAQSSPPLIRIDEWNASSRKLLKHGVFPVDEKSMSIMNDRCQTRMSAISDVLNNSKLSVVTEQDGDENLFEESTPETRRMLEHSKSRSFLLTVRQNSAGKVQNKQLLVTIEDEDENTYARGKKDRRGLVYRDDNVSLRSICSMEYPSRRDLRKHRTISVTEVELLAWPSSETPRAA